MNKTTNMERWQTAQINELAVWRSSPADADDWNWWWKDQFDHYSFLKDKIFENYLEVGCGPYAKNTINILSVLPKRPSMIYLNDPLIMEYLKDGKSVKNLIDKTTAISSAPLEEINFKIQMDCIVCINVLSHVYDVNKCMNNIHNLLKPKGILILGEELTNQEDAIRAPEILTDKMHPILFDEEEIRQDINCYNTIIYKTLNRESGRNPRAHYQTLLFVGEK